MPEAEGKTFEFEDYSSIKSDLLEPIDYQRPPPEATCVTEDFSAVCHFSGLPDIACVRLFYIPRKKIVELKSLKYYYTSFRNVGIYQEAATDRIYRDLYALLEPEFLEVETVYNTRGGIDTTCLINSEITGDKAPRKKEMET